MMGAFGRFLEVSVPAPDTLQSLAFYRALGFAELATGDIRPWHYAVVTNGSITVGLHREGIVEPALAFVRPNLARQVRILEDAGHDFEFRKLGAEEFNEAALRSPDGQLILMMEARTYSPGDDPAAAGSRVGSCTEVTLACSDTGATRNFFENAGFLAVEEKHDDVILLHTPGITLGLRALSPLAGATLRFVANDAPRLVRELEEKGLRPVRRPEGHVLRAPEGTLLVIAS